MSTGLKVAVLLATYNGGRYARPQVESLKDNSTRFTLHWVDDHSTDDTRQVVRESAAAAGICLREWHQEGRQGHPETFFHLVECVEADIYLFCDQDDIWQAGKIDATVNALAANTRSAVLCFSDALVFQDGQPRGLRRLSDVTGLDAHKSLARSRMFTSTLALGHTMGFTRALRELYLSHKNIARAHAFGHDWWMYLIAHASGTVHLLRNAPTTLYRRHGNNVTAVSFTSDGRISWNLSVQPGIRRGISRQAAGFVLASSTLPATPHLRGIVGLAERLATLHRRQSAAAILRLAHLGALPPNRRFAMMLAASCLCTDVTA